MSPVTSAWAPVRAARAAAVRAISRRWSTTWSRPAPATARAFCARPSAMTWRSPGGWQWLSSRASAYAL